MNQVVGQDLGLESAGHVWLSRTRRHYSNVSGILGSVHESAVCVPAETPDGGQGLRRVQKGWSIRGRWQWWNLFGCKGQQCWLWWVLCVRFVVDVWPSAMSLLEGLFGLCPFLFGKNNLTFKLNLSRSKNLGSLPIGANLLNPKSILDQLTPVKSSVG